MSSLETRYVEVQCGPDGVGRVLSVLRRYLPSNYRILSGRLSAAGAHLILGVPENNILARNAISQIRTLGAEVDVLDGIPPKCRPLSGSSSRAL